MCQGPEIEELGLLKELREGQNVSNIQKYTRKDGRHR